MLVPAFRPERICFKIQTPGGPEHPDYIEGVADFDWPSGRAQIFVDGAIVYTATLAPLKPELGEKSAVVATFPG